MNILLTGGAGYIGSHTAVILLNAGHKVFVVDNFCNSHVSTISAIQKITGKSLPYFESDIRNTDLLIDVLRNNQIEAVVHFAGLKAVGESTHNPLEYYANNVQGTISLVQAMQECAINELVFSSSATVYGDPQYLPIDEAHSLAPTNPYGQTKLQIEQILQDMCRADKNFKVVILRYFNPVGAHESGLIGENTKGIPNNLMPFVAQVAAGKQKSLSIYGNDYPTIDGTGVRDYIHVMDLAEGHLSALDYLKDNEGIHIFNLGTGSGHSVLELTKAFERQSGKNIPYDISPRRIGDIAACYANADKASLVLNWNPQYCLDEMCASAWKWQQSRRCGMGKDEIN
ncbi:UDP-glucose 4-epimerase GalE [Polynucleobacter paneuropaeus]|nr:UDP-glucose 4-epimerase GalE [Polynucleobacter paneuropaeus]